MIARVLKDLGFADELGSGVRNQFKYAPVFSPGAKPSLFEDDVFRIVVPARSTECLAQVEAQVELRVLTTCAETPLSSAAIAEALGHDVKVVK